MNKKYINKYKRFTLAVLKWLENQVLPGTKLSFSIKDQVLKIFKIFMSRGPKEAIRFCKERRALLFYLLSKNNKLDFSNDLHRIPKDLRSILSSKELSVPFIKLLLTIYSISRGFRTKPEPSFNSIEGPSELKEYPFTEKDFDSFWYTLGYSKKLKPCRSIEFKNYHKTTNAGPNGQALMFSLADLYSIPNTLLHSIKVLGGSKLESYIDLLLKYINNTFLTRIIPVFKGKVRKLSYFSDKEGKTREVAIFDYFSQTSLIPLHKYLFKALKKIPQDFTFDQTGFMSSLSNAEVFYSIDLTAFTDRFPIRINKDLLSSRIGPEKAEAWEIIMTQKLTVDNREICYSVGNPMGAYSSWNSTTLSHHFVVWKACKNKGVNWKTLPYAMLGDDLVIGNRLVALEYCRLIRTLGIHWSKEKTHISGHFFEFAKRYHWNGHDVSPFPISGLWSERNRLTGQVQVLDNGVSKGWFSASECIKSFDELLSYQGYPRRLRAKWTDLVRKTWTVMSILQKKASALELIPFVEKISPVVASKLDEEKTFNVLVNSIMLTFVDSNENITNKDKYSDGLGQMAENYTVYLTSLMFSEGFEDSISLPESLPHTHVWGLVSEDYLRANREAFIIDTIRGGNWDPLLKNLKIPTTDRSVYFNKKTELLYLHSKSIYDRFEENIRQLAMYPQLI
jgi:hypothetical protein